MKHLTKILLAVFAAIAANAEPPRFLAPMPDDIPQEKTVEDILPIPQEATEEEQELFKAAIQKAHEEDVSVTEPNALLYAGLGYLQDEEYDEARPYLQEALRRDPSLQAGWEGLGWTYIKNEDLKTAKAIWEYFRRLMPEQWLPYSLLGQLAVVERDWPLADKHFRKAMELNPDNEKMIDVRYWFAQNLMRLGQAHEAERVFRELLHQEPERLDIALDLASLLIQRLEYYEAVEIYRHVNDEVEDNPRLMVELAFLELKVGELVKADQLCRDVLEINPEDIEAMRLRADIAEISGLHDITPLENLIEQTESPLQRAALRVRLANRCIAENRNKPGSYQRDFILGLVEKAIEEDPASVDYRILYGQLLFMEERYAKARSVATAVLENFNQSNFKAKKLLLEIAIREQRLDDALQILSDLYAGIVENDPDAHFYRARIFTMQGRYADAKRELDIVEAAASKGSVLSLAYTSLTESDWTPSTPVRTLHEHILSLQQEGWTLISPAEIPSIIKPKEGEGHDAADSGADIPATARFFDYLRWCITGSRKFPPKPAGEKFSKQKKYFTVLFDGDLRSSLLLGNEVAEDFGVPFGIFVPTAPSKEYVPSRAGWDELREYAETGNWIIGSQLYESFEKMPVDKDGKDLRAPLPNRIWNEKRGRVESMSEWDRRLRNEFRASRLVLRQEMGKNDSLVPMVAYPFSDIGHAGACNLYSIRNPAGTIVAEAARSYRIGFVQSASGYTIHGDNPLVCRQYCPNWNDGGADVVRHAYESHPLFIARKLRAEISMLMDRPNEANAILAAMRQEGYPEDLCHALEASIQARFRNKPTRERPPLVADTDYFDDNTNVVISADIREGTDNPLVALANPYIGALVSHSKANDQVETFTYGGRAGLDLNRNTTLSFEATHSDLEQTVRPRWDAIAVTNVSFEKSKYKFKMEQRVVKGMLSHRTESGAILSATLGVTKKSVKDHPDLVDINLQDELNSHEFSPAKDETLVIGSVGAIWNPTDSLSLNVVYSHDYVSSAVKNIDYHGVFAGMTWKPEDAWTVDSQVQYRTYSDDNAFYSGFFESMWETGADNGIWAGLQLSTYSTSHPHDFYWTPYWDQRIAGVMRYTQQREGFNFRFDLLGGMSKSEARSNRYYETEVTEEKDVMVDGLANTVKETKTEYLPLEDGGAGWHAMWGFSGTYEKYLTPSLALIIEGQVMALRDYIDHTALIYLRFYF